MKSLAKTMGSVLWRFVKAVSIVVGILCFLLAFLTTQAGSEKRAAETLQVGMERSQVERCLQGWRVTSYRQGQVFSGPAATSFAVRYSAVWMRTVVYYDKQSRVVGQRIDFWQ